LFSNGNTTSIVTGFHTTAEANKSFIDIAQLGFSKISLIENIKEIRCQTRWAYLEGERIRLFLSLSIALLNI